LLRKLRRGINIAIAEGEDCSIGHCEEDKADVWWKLELTTMCSADK
jgi:hypothetical protein